MRLDRYISQVTELSRSEARSAIRAGRVSVDGSVIVQPAHPLGISAAVLFDEQTLGALLPRYYMLNKPAGVVCATQDPSHRTVLDLFAEILQPVGVPTIVQCKNPLHPNLAG